MHSFETSKSIEQKVMYSLKMIRKGKKLSQTDLAREMNVSRDTVARLESGRSRVTLAQVITIAQILDATLDKILSEPRIMNIWNWCSMKLEMGHKQQHPIIGVIIICTH